MMCRIVCEADENTLRARAVVCEEKVVARSLKESRRMEMRSLDLRKTEEKSTFGFLTRRRPYLMASEMEVRLDW